MTPWPSLRSLTGARPFPAASEGDDAPVDPTAPAPAFEGRPLRRPQEDVEDQGAAFDVGTLVSRRNALGVFGAGAGALVLAACGVPASTTASSSAATTSMEGSSASSGSASGSASDATEMKTETAGPYPGDGSNGPDVLEASGIERRDLTTSIDGGGSMAGVPLTLTMRVLDLSNGGAPMEDAAVYAWHANAEGQYSMYSTGVTDQTWGRGVQVTDAAGEVTFTTVFPGCYDGRWPHIHFEVFSKKADITDAANAILTSQLAMPQAACEDVYQDTAAYPSSAANLAKVTLATDNVFSDGADQQTPSVTGSASKGYTMTIDVPIDPSTAQQTAAAPGGGAGGPGGPGGQPPAGGPQGPGSRSGASASATSSASATTS